MVGNPVWGRPRGRFARIVASVLVLSFVTVGAVHAQRVAAADATGRSAETQAVTLDVDHATLTSVIRAIAHKAGLVPVYDDAIIPAEVRVTLHLKNVPASEAFQAALKGTGLVAQVQATGSVAIVQEGSAAVALGNISGVVRDEANQHPLRGASVVLDDSSKKVARTDDDGHYRLLGVAAGQHRVTVRLVGFARQTKVVTVADDQTASADFVLSSSVNTLDQVVVTATGAQRYRELGHVVAQINADSLVREAPITSLSELLTSRVPGLQVFSGNGGNVGGEVALRLRSQTTTALDPQPIVIVDGVRYKNTNVFDHGDGSMSEDYRPFFVEARSPLNDLNVNDIETVEVVKGPSASTLYGPDAANGVIVITTKRGRPGKAQWHIYAYPDLSVVPSNDVTSQPSYRGWGHDPNTGELYPANCSLAYQAEPYAQCVLDSITVVPSANNSAQYGVIATTRPQWHSGASVNGGSQTLTYFFSGNLDSQTGAIKLSPFAANILKQQLGTPTLSSALKDPNTQQMLSLHTNVASQLSATSNLTFIGDYTRATQRTINIPNIYNQTYKFGAPPPGFDTSAANLSQYLPVNAFLQSTQENLQRLVATVRGSIQPWSWLTATGDIGTDISASVDRGVEQQGAEGPGFGGTASDYRRNNTGRNADVGLTSLGHRGIMSFRTSVGANYTYVNIDGLDAYAYNLAPGSTSISTAQQKGVEQEWSETASLGTYGEEVVGFNDRLFLTGSMRLDGSTTFGDSYHPRPFPKMGASWIVSDEPFMQRLHVPGLTEFRLRYSYGASSRYPTSTMKFGTVNATNVNIDAQQTSIFVRTLWANPIVRPEHTREAEWGTDLTLASNIQIGLTWFNRRTSDQLNTLTVPYGFLPEWANVGTVSAHGFEATLTAPVLSTRLVGLDLNASYAYKANKILSLGSASEIQYLYGSRVVGYPIDASFGQTIQTAVDSNGDGIIGYNEVTLSPVHYLGTFDAPNVYTLTPVASLLGAHVRVSATFDRQSGGVQRDQYAEECAYYGTCLAAFLKTTSFLEQAKFQRGDYGPFIISSNFTRWRELSVTSELPAAWRDKVGFSRASVSLQVRNLMLWTNYKGPDPESVPGLGTTGYGSAVNGATGIPQPRSWAIRFDLSP